MELAQGESVQLGRYTLTMQDLTTGQNDNYLWGKLKVAVSKNGENIGVIEPERRMYVVAQQGTSEVAIRRRLNEDLYINFAGTRESKAIIQAYVFPLVSWIWIGYWVVLIGTLICLVPSKTKLVFPRMEVVGVAATKKVEEHA